MGGFKQKVLSQGSRLATIFWECASKNLTLVALVRVHGLRCSKARVLPAAAHCSRRKIHWSGAFSASASVEPGLHLFPHRTRKQSRSGAYAEREQRAPIVLSLAASAQARRCAQRTEHNGGFGFQTKVKDHFLNQRRWTCWYSCREQVLSATASLVLLVFLFSFWKACYLCCLPHVTQWRLSLFFYIIIIWFLSVC